MPSIALTQTSFRQRRRALRLLGCAPLALTAPLAARAANDVRSLSFYHTHTDERLSLAYFASGAYLPDALVRLNLLLRDFRTGQSIEMDCRLFDTLFALNQRCGAGTFEIVSGFRSNTTNEWLHTRSRGVASNSLHLQGRAIDVRLAGRDTRHLRDAALGLAQGGVGYYAKSDFVHLDTGAPRVW